MKRAKAKLNLEEKLIRVEYKGLKAKNPFTYTKPAQNKHVTFKNMNYSMEENDTTDNAIVPFRKEPNLGLSDDEYSFSGEDSNGEDDEGQHGEENLNESLESDTSESEEEILLLMLEDEYNEHSNPNKFGQLGIQQVPFDSTNFDIFVYDNYFCITPQSYRECKLSMNYILDQEKFKENPKFQVVLCDIEHEQLRNKESGWIQSASHIVQKEDTVFLLLVVNDTDKALIMDPGEMIAKLDIIYMSDVEEFNNAFKLGKIRTDEIPYELFSHESFDPNFKLKKYYEERIKDKIDISHVPSEVRLEFLDLIILHQYDHIFDWNNDKIGNINVGEHIVKLKPDAVPRRVKPFRLSRIETECLQKELDKPLALGSIEKSGYLLHPAGYLSYCRITQL